jgi:hypothetical protein
LEEDVSLLPGHLQDGAGFGVDPHSSDQVLTGWPVSSVMAMVSRE